MPTGKKTEPESHCLSLGRKRKERDYDSDDLNDVACCLLVLSRSGGGFYSGDVAAAIEAEENPNQDLTQFSLSFSAGPSTVAAASSSRSPDTPLPSTVAGESSNYPCNLCSDVFSSYRALGGHKTKHRPKNPTVNVNGATVSALNPSGREHKCSVCGETFTSGQALGGHKSKHYKEGLKSRKNIGAQGCTNSSNGGDIAERSGVTTDGGAATRVTEPVAGNLDLTLRLGLPSP